MLDVVTVALAVLLAWTWHRALTREARREAARRRAEDQLMALLVDVNRELDAGGPVVFEAERITRAAAEQLAPTIEPTRDLH